MKAKISSIVIFLCLLVLGSCKKTDPPAPDSGSPVFYFNGTVNGTPISISAGVNNYYMFTSYALDANGVYDLIGELKDYNCSSNCANSVKVSIKDYRKYSLGATQIDSTLVSGYYAFATPAGAPSKYSVLFKDTMFNGTAQSYAWTFGDGTTSNIHRPTHTYAHPGIYTVSLTNQSTIACTSTLTNEIMLGQTGNPITMGFGSNAVGNAVSFASSISGGTPSYTSHWDFGDGNTTTTTTTTTSHTYATAGVYLVTLSVTDAANVTQTYYAFASTQGTSNCYTYFYPPNAISTVANPMNLADVTVEWRDASGTLYTSANNSQSYKSMFKIISVADYQNNASGQATKIIRAKVNCTVYNGATSLPLIGDIVFSVAHL